MVYCTRTCVVRIHGSVRLDRRGWPAISQSGSKNLIPYSDLAGSWKLRMGNWWDKKRWTSVIVEWSSADVVGDRLMKDAMTRCLVDRDQPSTVSALPSVLKTTMILPSAPKRSVLPAFIWYTKLSFCRFSADHCAIKYWLVTITLRDVI